MGDIYGNTGYSGIHSTFTYAYNSLYILFLDHNAVTEIRVFDYILKEFKYFSSLAQPMKAT